MKPLQSLLKTFAVTVALLAIASVGSANVWVDETFEDGPFTQGTGNTTTNPPSTELDVYSNNALTATITASPLTNTGSTTTAKFFQGTPGTSYQLDPGDVLGVGSNYQDPGDGDFVIFQFAANVDPIPAAGTAAIFRFNWDTDTSGGADPDHSFFVRFDSTGSAVDIIAGEDVANSPTTSTLIGQLSSAADWKFITMVMVNNAGPSTYTHPNLPGGGLTLTEGVYFYCSSTTQGAFIPFTPANSLSKAGRGWSFTVTSGVLYIDDLYWEGGMEAVGLVDPPAEALRHIRPFDKGGPPPAAVGDWLLF
ncbi:MAG: hypothetical protein Kow0059_16250 [Candidatus Sumerlaeia bacterium]